MIATPTWGTSSSISDYFKESQDNYYQQEGDLGVWQGKAAKALGFEGTIAEKDLENALMGKNSKGEQVLKNMKINDKGERERAGLDLTFNAPKSVSLAYELAKATGNTELAEKLVDIHNEATSKVLDKFEKNFSQARVTKDGVTEHKDTKNLAIAKFQHDTSRPVTDEKGNVSVDPSLHTHAVIMNMTKAPDGKYKAIESKKIYENYMSMGMEYRSLMSSELKNAGFEINVTDHNKGFYEIKLTNDEKLDEKYLEDFSIRSKQIADALPALKEQYPNKTESELKQLAAHSTREFKGEINRDEVRQSNLERALELGLSVENINNLSDNMKSKAEFNKNLTDEQKQEIATTEKEKAVAAIKVAIEATTSEKSVFEHKDISEKVQKYLLADAINPKVIDEAFKEQFKAKGDDKIIALNSEKYTTKEILDTERSVLDLLDNSKSVKQIHTQKEAKEKLDKYSQKESEKKGGFALTKGQSASAHLILSSKDGVIGIQGDAGTGKTSMLKAVNSLKGDTKLFGLSYTGKAASEIESATKEKNKANSSQQVFNQGGIKSSTVASFLGQIDKPNFDIEQFKNSKLIVDEASMLGIKDAQKLLDFSKKANAQIVLMGDLKQFKAIGAGDPFQLLQDNGMKTENMNEVLRQNDKTLLAAVNDLNKYDSSSAFERLDKADKIHELKENDNVIEKIKDDFFKSKNEPKDTLAVASVKDTFKNNLILTNTNETKDILNESIRNEMRSREFIDKEDVNLKIRESSRLTSSQKYFADNYKESNSIFLQDDIFVQNKDKFEKLKSGSEYKIVAQNSKDNTLTVIDKDNKSHTIDLKKNSQAIQAYEEKEKDFANGEKLVFEKNDKKLGVKNGTVGEIKSVDKEGNLKVKLDDKTISFNSKDYNYFNHGYAVTSYKAQGQTAENVIAYMPAKAQNFNSFYVTVTRAQDNLTIYTDSKDDLKSTIYSEQIKDNAISLNEKADALKAKDIAKQKLTHEERKAARQEAYNNAPASKRQSNFANSIAKELGVDVKDLDLSKRVVADTFIKDNLEAYSKAQNSHKASDKQVNFTQKIADKLYHDIDVSKMNVKEVKSYITDNAKAFDNAVKNPTEHLLSVDASKLSEHQQDNYFKDLTRAEMFSAYKKDIDTLEKLDAKHDKEFPQIGLEEKQIKIDLYATAYDIKAKDYLEVMNRDIVGLQFEENIKKRGLDKPHIMAKELKSEGLNYQDEKHNIVADLILEKQFDHLMEKQDGTNDKELGERNERMVNFVNEFREQLVETREYESKVNDIKEAINDGEVYRAAELIEENKEVLNELDLEDLEKNLDEKMDSEFESIQDDLEKEFDNQEEFLQEELKEDTQIEELESDKIEELNHDEDVNMEELDELYKEVMEADLEQEKEDEHEYER